MHPQVEVHVVTHEPGGNQRWGGGSASRQLTVTPPPDTPIPGAGQTSRPVPAPKDLPQEAQQASQGDKLRCPCTGKAGCSQALLQKPCHMRTVHATPGTVKGLNKRHFIHPLKRKQLTSQSEYIASLVAQIVKCLPAMWETRVRSLGWEDPLEKEMATHSSTLAWNIPWTEEPGRLQSMGSQRVRHD